MNIVLNLLQFFPAIFHAVKAVEDTCSAEPGATKKQLILDSVMAAAKVGETVLQAEVAMISGLIDSTVAMLKASGIFKHAPKLPIAPATPEPAIAPPAK